MSNAPIKEFEPRSRSRITDQRIKSPMVYLLPKVIPKTLWIDQVIHALTVTKAWVIHALTVTTSRINGHHTIYSLYLPIVKTPVVGASLFGDNLAGCHPNRLHLPPTADVKKTKP